MNLTDFNYKDNFLFCENVSLKKIAQEVGTPFYVYSKNHLVNQFKLFTDAFSSIEHKIFYATKSNSNISIMNLFYKLGAGIDVNSGGELHRALKIGVNPENILFTGVGKTESEINMGLEKNVFLFKAESSQEILLMNQLAGNMNKKARIAIRVNPNVDPKTHPYIATGLYDSKFGIDQKEAVEVFKFANSLPNIIIAGIDMHIGSQITKVSAFCDAVKIIVELKIILATIGIKITHLDVGGGLGIQYDAEETPNIEDYANSILTSLKDSKCKVFFEPGRFLTGNSGALISKVLYTKKHSHKNFLIVDSAITELLRPALYKAYHHILPIVQENSKPKMAYDVVGPVCETGDYLALDRELQESEPNDLLAIMTTGAYGSVMGSNYNSRRKPPEILVDDEDYFIIRNRETFDDLIKNEVLI